MARKGTNIHNDAGEMDKKITPSPSKPVVHFDTKAHGLSVEELTANWPIKKSQNMEEKSPIERLPSTSIILGERIPRFPPFLDKFSHGRSSRKWSSEDIIDDEQL